MNPIPFLIRNALISSLADKAQSEFGGGLPSLLRGSTPTIIDSAKELFTGLGNYFGLIPPQPTSLPEDYYVSPYGITSSSGEPMITGEGVLGFQPANQYINYEDNPYGEFLYDEKPYDTSILSGFLNTLTPTDMATPPDTRGGRGP